MKKTRMILSALIIFAVVGSALAFKTKDAPDVLFCVVSTHTCIDQTNPSFPSGALDYSTQQTSSIVTNPVITPFTTTGNRDCSSTGDCKAYTGTIYINE